MNYFEALFQLNKLNHIQEIFYLDKGHTFLRIGWLEWDVLNELGNIGPWEQRHTSGFVTLLDLFANQQANTFTSKLHVILKNTISL